MTSLHSHLEHAKIVNENLKRESKHLQKKVVVNDKVILNLHEENENLAKTVKKNESDIINIQNKNAVLLESLVPKSKSSKYINTNPMALSVPLPSPTLSCSDEIPETLVEESSVISKRGHPPQQMCSHTPQCFTREPHLPPASFPLNWNDHHDFFEPKAPPSIRILPSNVNSVQAFNSLHNNHLCDDCDHGSLFFNHYEMVHSRSRTMWRN